MKKRTLFALPAIILLILDSRCAADSAREALGLCGGTLIPSLFPLFVLGAYLTPGLAALHIPGLAGLLGFPRGGEGFFLLGCAGGYPLGAACIAQAVEHGSLRKADGERMAGLCSLCGPGFLFGVVAAFLSIQEALALFLIQLEAAAVTAAFWPAPSAGFCQPSSEPVSLPAAVSRAVRSMTSVCAWVTLAAVAVGFLKKWCFPFLSEGLCALLTGMLELTNGLTAIRSMDSGLRFLWSALFISFGGISVLLQISAILSQAGLRMKQCIAQKAVHGVISTALAALLLRFGGIVLSLIPMLLFAKLAVEIPRTMVYNGPRKEGI